MEHNIKVGMKVRYKRQGGYGHYDSEVAKVTEKGCRLRLLTWCGQPVKKGSFCNASLATMKRYNRELFSPTSNKTEV